jgi:hypothetical protein
VIINVAGFDPSLTHWGIAEAQLDLTTGYLTTPKLTIVEPTDVKGKQVRVNSKDLHRSEQLSRCAFDAALNAQAIFVEVPVGSQSARSMASYGICVGILSALRAQDIPLIEVTATEVKLSLTSNKNASKRQMIDKAFELYPEANWPWYKRNGETLMADKAEHVADAIGAIHAGVLTPTFQNMMRLMRRTIT